ncbi:MAG: DUF6111 family protein [Pseudomonadota bacterium]|jgi:hypothetical protein
MLRLILLNLFLFLLPTALFAAYVYIKGRGKGGETGPDSLPLRILLPAGLGLIMIGMLITAYAGGEDPSGTYVPARMENGKLVPGKVD